METSHSDDPGNRLRLALSKTPWSLGIALGMIAFFTPHPEWHGDLLVFREHAETLRHPAYTRWLFALLAIPPEPVAYVALSLVSTALLYFAARSFGGKHWMVFTSFAFAWTLFYGQIDGLAAGGLAVAWWARERSRPVLLGAGLTLASIKPQISAPLAFVLWWWSPSRLKSLIVPGITLAASFLQWGFWLPSWTSELGRIDDLVLLSRNISLWPQLGPWVLLAWPAILALPLPRHHKLIAVAAGTAMTSPYFPLPSEVVFLSMPVPWWVWAVSQGPILSGYLGSWPYHLMKALPPALLISVAWPAVRSKLHDFRAARSRSKDVQ